MEKEELTGYDTTPEVLADTKSQIEKDLGFTGFTYTFDQPHDLPHLVGELSEHIEILKSRGGGDLMKVIYRVDLTEKQYKKLSAFEGPWHINLAKAIVLREFQKVLLRRKFSS